MFCLENGINYKVYENLLFSMFAYLGLKQGDGGWLEGEDKERGWGGVRYSKLIFLNITVVWVLAGNGWRDGRGEQGRGLQAELGWVNTSIT